MEQWRQVGGYEEFLEVSNLGNVRTVARQIPLNGGLRYFKSIQCKLCLKRNGYFQVAVRLGGKDKRKWFLVHRIVALAFIPNPENLPQINHKDGNKTNNTVSNLEWCNSSHNQNHAVKMGLCSNEESHYKAKLTASEVREIRASNDSSKVAGEKYGVDKSTVKAIRRFKTWKYV